MVLARPHSKVWFCPLEHKFVTLWFASSGDVKRLGGDSEDDEDDADVVDDEDEEGARTNEEDDDSRLS